MTQTEKSAPSIHFGTDGWRGVIADDFTFENVRLVARAVGRYVLAHEDASRGLVVGYDCRFMSDRFARAVAEEIAAAGIPARLAESYTSTPAVAFAVRQQGAAGAVMVTASHNPWRWNGIKFKASYGGSAAPEIVKKIEAELPAASQAAAARTEGAKLVTADLVTADLVGPYLRHIEQAVDLKNIAKRGFAFVFDPMYGAARGCVVRLLEKYGIRCREIHGEADPMFGGLNPEPIEPHISGLRQAVLESKADVGFATDGDADRVGAIDRTGQFIDSHQIFSILLRYLAEGRGMKGGVTKTFSTTKLVDKLAARYSLPLYETPIGFKYICDRMLSTDILIGGEESGGIGIPSLGGPERDGVLMSVLLAEAMAYYGKSLGELVAELHREFGPHHYGRVDLELRPEQKDRAVEEVSREGLGQFVGYGLLRRENMDGVKLYLENGAWLLVRPSGTEPLLRIYVEAESQEAVRETLSRTEKFVRGL
ncbi:MAG: phosphoglucomutase/phosphomannomutase family protein [Acidobacteria bacterium]|nr:phosphoglucomutase/phosphomannomutase family protein [Acidobacteriota bacterium]